MIYLNTPNLKYKCTSNTQSQGWQNASYRRCSRLLLFFSAIATFSVDGIMAQNLEPATLVQSPLATETSSELPVGRSRRHVLVVTGAAGDEAYQTIFRNWSERWTKACQQAGISYQWINGAESNSPSNNNDEAPNDKSQLLAAIQGTGDSELWLVLIGHGTFDGKVAKFNLRGDDITAQELAAGLDSSTGPQVLVHCFSCSGAFLPVLSKSGRVVITATKSGTEFNFSRFGDYLSQAIIDSSADLDHDQSVSILEAFLMGAKRTEQFYADDRRLATEHPLLDDGGDGKGVSANFFQGIRLVKEAADGSQVDGTLAASSLLVPSKIDTPLTMDQLSRRDELESQLRELRSQKATLNADEYYRRLAPIALELAEIYDVAQTKAK
jgi:hypothetical protein